MIEDREEMKKLFKGFYDEVEAILFRLDPIGINFGDNPDEYAPEVDTILPRLKDAESIEDIQDIVYEEFVALFGADTAGEKTLSVYRKAGEEIWDAWTEYSKSST